MEFRKYLNGLRQSSSSSRDSSCISTPKNHYAHGGSVRGKSNPYEYHDKKKYGNGGECDGQLGSSNKQILTQGIKKNPARYYSLQKSSKEPSQSDTMHSEVSGVGPNPNSAYKQQKKTQKPLLPYLKGEKKSPPKRTLSQDMYKNQEAPSTGRPDTVNNKIRNPNSVVYERLIPQEQITSRYNRSLRKERGDEKNMNFSVTPPLGKQRSEESIRIEEKNKEKRQQSQPQFKQPQPQSQPQFKQPQSQFKQQQQQQQQQQKPPLYPQKKKN